MADKTQKSPKNIAGKYYVDNTCIDCGLCYQSAPEFFAKDDDSDFAYVQKQPNGQDQIAQCENILENCPVQAIGNDGINIA